MSDIKTSDLRPAIVWLSKKGMTQDKIAELFGVKRHTVGKALATTLVRLLVAGAFPIGTAPLIRIRGLGVDEPLTYRLSQM